MANSKNDAYLGFIDISHNQQTFDATVAKRAGLSGVIARTSDGMSQDRRVVAFLKEGARAGLLLGVYHFCRPLARSGERRDPTNQARFFLSATRAVVEALGRPLDLPLMGDVETYWIFQGVTGTPIPGAEFAAWLKVFFQVVEQEGRDLVAPGARVPNIYTNLNFWKAHVANATGFGRFGFVAARFVGSQPPPSNVAQWRDFAFRVTPSVPDLLPGMDQWDGWQFSAQGNRFAHEVGVDLGIEVPLPSGGTRHPDVDCDLFLAASIQQWTGQTGPGPGTGRGPITPLTFDTTEQIVNQLPVINPGDTGDHVKRVQALLLVAGFNPGALDGVYTTDPNSPTRKAIVAFQQAKGLAQDGNVGTKQTWPALLGL